MFRSSALLRVLGRTALVLYFLAAALFLVVRYAVLPNVDHFRPQIQARLSSALDTQITFGRIEAGWKGWHPDFQLYEVAIMDEGGRQVLRLPRIGATLSWKGLLSGVPSFSYIEAVGLDIEARRDTQRRIWVLGKDIEPRSADDRSEMALDDEFVQWLAQQPRVALRDAVISWRDDTRDSTQLQLNKVTLGLVSEPGLHSLVLGATPPQGLGQRFEMRARFEHADKTLPTTNPLAWGGTFYFQVDDMAPTQWRPWVDVPSNLLSGKVSARWWLTFEKEQLQRVAAQAEVLEGDWRLGENDGVSADAVQLFLDGSWQGYKGALAAFEALNNPSDAKPVALDVAVAHHDAADRAAWQADTMPEQAAGQETPVRFWLKAQGLALNVQAVFEHAPAIEQIEMRGSLGRNASQHLALRFDNARVINQDMDLQWRGGWQEGGSGGAGLADMEGIFHRASLSGLHRYMPKTVNPEAREWLAKGLLDGEIVNATAVLHGDLEHFPFAVGPGRFRINGAFHDAVIDYAPARAARAGWPALRQVNGRASLDRVDLRLQADEAIVVPAEGQVIQLRDISARIPNIEKNAVLSVQGESGARAPAYLALARHSPLSRLLDGFLDPAQAEGQWEVPIKLTIPLMDVDDTRVQGSVQFQGGSVALESEAPAFEQVRGTLDFSETGFSVQGLQADFFGSPVSFDGGIGGKRAGLTMKGKMTAEALQQYVGTRGMQRLTGTLAYTAKLRQQPSGRYAMRAQSGLNGFAIDLPAPVGKTAQAAEKLEVQWVPAPAAGEMYLKVALGTQMLAQFARREGGDKGPYFHSGAIGTALPAKLPVAGLAVDVQQPSLDVNEWEAIVDEFSTPLQASTQAAREVFPPLQRMRLKADRMTLYGLELAGATLTAQREQSRRWRMDVASTGTAGTLHWNQADGASGGRVNAHFDRLALGDMPDSGNKAEPARSSDDTEPLLKVAEEDGSWDERVDIPAVDLKVDKLTLYGRHVGKLAVEGVSEQGGQFWRLNKLALSSPGAQLHGSGIWRLSGHQRGLTLDADMRFSDAGAFLDQIDMKNVMEGGEGSVKGRFEWRNMPWDFQRSDLNGQLRLELEDGRFSTVNSKSARLLELLSLQSLRRIATFNLNPGSLFKEGFPFDRLAGTLHIHEGVMTTNDYQVTSPVATISIGGDVDLKSEQINLQAMVVPKLDVSGATVAAGILNPIVGLGAFVTQWLLSKPLSKAMTLHYDVTGDLNSPQLHEAAVVRSQEEAASGSQIEGAGVELDDKAGNGLHDATELRSAGTAAQGLRP